MKERSRESETRSEVERNRRRAEEDAGDRIEVK